MNRTNKLIVVVAVAAAAIAPAAQARTLPYPPEEPGATAADWAKEVPAPAGIAPCSAVPDDLPAPVPGDDTCPDAVAPRAIASAADATGITNSPSNGWIVVKDDLGLEWLVPVASATPATPSNRVVAVSKPSAAKQRGFWGTYVPHAVTLITDNSPSQNKLTRRNIAA
jgi:hypothetical protein